MFVKEKGLCSMKICKIILICSFLIYGAGYANEPEYLVQVLIKKEKKEGGDAPEIVASMQAHARIDSDFYSRSVSDGYELLLSGRIHNASEKQDGLNVGYYFRRNDLRDSPEPPIIVKGSVSIARVTEPQKLKEISGPLESKLTSWIVVQSYHTAFNLPGIGHLVPNPEWMVELVDDSGNPVSEARTAMYDENWEQVTGVAKSDGKGIVRLMQREELPILIFVAKHLERGLFASAHIDRDHEGPLKIVMKKRAKIPEGFPNDLYE